jgi:N-acetylmuramoyl-L-alanine amidase
MACRRIGWCSGLCVLALLPPAVVAQAEPIQLAALALAPPADPGIPPAASALDCLALNIYWEARSEPLAGQIAVAEVTLSRVADPAFPDTVCGVVRQGEERGLNLCQFSWHCDGLDDRPHNSEAWQHALRLALLALSGRLADPTDGALWFHSDQVHPDWPELAPILKIGSHIFYRASPARDEARARAEREAGPPLPPGEKPAPPVRMAAAEVMPKVMRPVPAPSADPVPSVVVVGSPKACARDLGGAAGGPDLMRALATTSRDEFLAAVDRLRRDATRERPCTDAKPGDDQAALALVLEARDRDARTFAFEPMLPGDMLAAAGERWAEPPRLPQTLGAPSVPPPARPEPIPAGPF